MLQLYFWPMACSLSNRIALMEAGIEARYRLMHLWNKTVVEDGSDFRSPSPKGAVPLLILENGERLTESAAVLQYIADLRPELGLAPPPGSLERYRLQEWLSFVGCEIHRAFLFPTFWSKDDAAKAAARERIGQSVSVAAEHLGARPYLVGDRFTVADAHLTWFAAARLRWRRCRAVAFVGRLSQAHARAPAREGGD
jgi:glutathione S-transferase